ncbi:MAG: hypothetical protein ACSLEY_00395 [Candidatus Saccharimonadales bacterium]
MQRQRAWSYALYIILLAVLLVVSGRVNAVLATTSSSTNYQATEMEFNAGAQQEGCSTNYCTKVSIGDMTVQQSNSPSTAAFGTISSNEPLLEVIVDQGESNLGVLTAEHAATKTMVIHIRNYLSAGYVLQITGTPPKYGSHTLSTPSTPTASIPGTEQFGINAVANTLPNVGADPVQSPSSEFSYGVVDNEYATTNMFKYESGDVVARSQTASGQTSYTVSMIMNISNSTPAGHYSGDYSAVVIPVY